MPARKISERAASGFRLNQRGHRRKGHCRSNCSNAALAAPTRRHGRQAPPRCLKPLPLSAKFYERRGPVAADSATGAARWRRAAICANLAAQRVQHSLGYACHFGGRLR